MQAVLSQGVFLAPARSRALAPAVVVSFLFHALLLFGFTFLHDAARRSSPPAPIIARLSPPRPAPAPAAQVAPEPAVEKPVPVQPPKPAVTPQSTPAQKAVPVAKPVPSAPAAAPVEAPRAADPAPAAPPTPSASAPSAAPAAPAAKAEPQPSAAPPSVDNTDAATVAQYRMAVITAARRYKRYPRIAMDNNWEGRAEVRMVIGANGMIASLAIRTSAGRDVLDKAAMDMIRNAKPLIPIPSALRGREFTVDIPVVFSLKEDAQG